jgi:two-component system, sensor histidine kinase FlrB
MQSDSIASSQLLVESHEHWLGRDGEPCRCETSPMNEVSLKAFEALPASVVILDAQGVVNYQNPAARKLLGAHLNGKLWRTCVDELIDAGLDDELSADRNRTLSLDTCPLPSREGQIVVLHDVTEVNELREQLMRKARLEKLGEVAATLAHQIRTPLAAASLYADQLEDAASANAQSNPADHERLRAALGTIEQRVKQMLMYVRGQVAEKQPVLLASVFEEVALLVRERLKSEKVKLNIDSGATLPVVLADKDSLVCALENLIINAVEAGADRIAVAGQSVAGDRSIDVRVNDNGPGIDDELLPCVSNAFFTTRAQGTGLGLAIVSNIVRSHDGIFNLRTSHEHGLSATFRIPAAGFMGNYSEHGSRA